MKTPIVFLLGVVFIILSVVLVELSQVDYPVTQTIDIEEACYVEIRENEESIICRPIDPEIKTNESRDLSNSTPEDF